MDKLRKDEDYDAKEAYNKNLSASARFNYLKNERHDHNMAASKMLASNSPAKNQNKGYADSRELTDMPLTKDMTGGRGVSWMSKHATQRFSSPVKAAKPDYIDADNDGNETEPMKEAVEQAKKADSGSGMKMISPLNRYDEVVEGGNKGDKSKTKPGKKDY
tara:strand:- start:71 stop:553 length:483 start_codon:yes stop_codon:yes gene_type:complete